MTMSSAVLYPAAELSHCLSVLLFFLKPPGSRIRMFLKPHRQSSPFLTMCLLNATHLNGGFVNGYIVFYSQNVCCSKLSSPPAFRFIVTRDMIRLVVDMNILSTTSAKMHAFVLHVNTNR